ncbi:MAG: hypothetical protein E7208_09365 [Clostridium butyricum]|nr:hypothetical protein [Clostridium butyricum]
MNIIKKKGHKEEFNISKVRQSVLNASTEINQTLSDADLNIIEKEVLNKLQSLQREEATSSYEVFAVVLYVLKELGFNKVGSAYFKGSIEF